MQTEEKRTEADKARSRKWEDLRVEYQLLVSDIQFAKNQQWKVTNYGVAVYVGVVSTFLCEIFLCQFFEERQILTDFSYRV